MITFASNSKMRGMFKIERHKVDHAGQEVPGSREVVAPWQDNLITDAGLDNLGSTNWMRVCHLGAGNAAPSFSDTALQSPIAEVSGNVAAGPTGTGYSSALGTYVFGQGVAVGIIAEIGVSPPGGSLTTRALIVDENGDPTTITVGPIDVLTVTYQLREYPDTSDTTTQVTNSHTSVTYAVVQRALYSEHSHRVVVWHLTGPVGNPSGYGQSRPRAASGGLRPPQQDDPQGTTASSGASPAYVPGNHYKDVTGTWDESVGNISGGITRIEIGEMSNNPQSFHSSFGFQASFDPPIDKTNAKVLTVTLRRSWGRL